MVYARILFLILALAPPPFSPPLRSSFSIPRYAFETGDQAQAVSALRPRQVRRSAPERAVDAGGAVQRQRAHLEHRIESADQIVRSVPAAGASCPFHRAQELDRHRLR